MRGLLVEQITDVNGLKRRANSFNTSLSVKLKQDPLGTEPRLVLHEGDPTDNLSAQDHVAVSFEHNGDAQLYSCWNAVNNRQCGGIHWGLLQQGQPEQIVIATRQQYRTRLFIKLSAKAGTGATTIGHIAPRCFWGAEMETLLGDPTRMRDMMGWSPTTTLEELVSEMVAADRDEDCKEQYLRLKGFPVVGRCRTLPSPLAPKPRHYFQKQQLTPFTRYRTKTSTLTHNG